VGDRRKEMASKRHWEASVAELSLLTETPIGISRQTISFAA
jgi:hypothetical protein